MAKRSNVALRSVKLPCFNRGVIQVDQGHLPPLPVLAIKKSVDKSLWQKKHEGLFYLIGFGFTVTMLSTHVALSVIHNLLFIYLLI